MKKIICLIILLLLFISSSSSAFAASFSLDPVTTSSQANSSFTVDLDIDTGGVQTTGANAILTYDTTVLEVVSVAYPASPPYSTNSETIDNTNGRLTINSSATSQAYAYSGTGTMATITLKGLIAGSSSLSFLCVAGSTTDSNIINTSVQDILDCSQLTNGSYTITSSAGGDDTTPTATPTISSGIIDDDTELPESGTTEVTLAIAALSIFFLFIGTKLMLAKKTS